MADCSPFALPPVNGVGEPCAQDTMLPSGDDRAASSSGPSIISVTSGGSSRIAGLVEKQLEASGKLRQMRKYKEKHRKKLRDKLPLMNELRVKRMTYSYKHYTFFDLLQDGFIKTHAELFRLLTFEEDKRREAGPKAPLWFKKTLEQQADKLCMMSRRLMQAESAMRMEDYLVAYEQHYSLAVFFANDPDDKWLSDHFYFNCMNVATKMRAPDAGPLRAEASINAAKVFESLDLYDESLEQLEYCYDLTDENETWLVRDSDDATIHNDCCVHMHRVYTKLGIIELENGDTEASVQYYLKAYNAAREGGGRTLFNEACLQLGFAYERNDEPDTALLHLHNLLGNCCAANDREYSMKAMEAMGMAYQSKGQLDESAMYFDEFVLSADEQQQPEMVVRGCNAAGYVYNLFGEYEKSVEYFRKACTVPLPTDNCASVLTATSSRVLFGIGQAHSMMPRMRPYVYAASEQCFECIFDWKDDRQDTFSPDIPTRTSIVRRDSRRREEFRKEMARRTTLMKSQQKARRKSRRMSTGWRSSVDRRRSSRDSVESDISTAASSDVDGQQGLSAITSQVSQMPAGDKKEPMMTRLSEARPSQYASTRISSADTNSTE